MWNQQVCTWFRRSWIQSSCCYYWWPSFKCQCVYTAARNIGWWQQKLIKHPAYADFGTKAYIKQCNPSIQKHQKQSEIKRNCFRHCILMFHEAIDVPGGYISRRIFHEVHEREENFQAHLRKAPKIRYKVTHPGNNKLSALLTLAIFQESITAVIKNLFPNQLEAANFLILSYKVFVICNSKQRFNTSIQLGNVGIQGDRKPEFILLVAARLGWNMVKMSIIYPYQTNLSCFCDNA